MILMGDGSYKPLGEIAVGDMVVTHAGRARRVLAVHEQGDLPCVRLVTRNGRETVAALEHPFLTPSGWVEAGDLRTGVALANVARPSVGAPVAVAEAFRLAGYFVGDGTVGATGATTLKVRSFSASITAYDAEEREDIAACAARLGFGLGRPDGKDIPLVDGVRAWLAEIGLARVVSRSKRVPPFVFRGTPDLIGHFVGAYFACDGHVNRRGGARADAAVEFYSVNVDLLRDVQRLLLRLGIQARLSAKHSTFNAYVQGPHTSYRLTISSQDDVARFIERVPVYHAKRETLAGWGVVRQRFDEAHLPDTLVTTEPVGEKPCRCLTVEEDATFTADDLVVHNSQAISHYFPAWYLGTHPEHRVLLASYGADFAADWGRKARDVLTEWGPRLYDVAVSDQSSAADRWDLAGHVGGMVTGGVGGPFTGRGADCLLIDDPVKNAEEALSATRRDHIWDWYLSTASTRLEPDAVVCVVLTRWHQDDLAGRLIEAMAHGGEPWEVLVLPALAEEADALGRAAGEALWPERFGVEQLDAIRRRLESDLWWYALYQQRPTPQGGATFHREWFSRRYRELPALTLVVQAVDSAFKTGVASDYSVIATWGTDGRDFYLVDVWRARVEYPELKRAIVDQAARHRPDAVLIEDAASGQSAIQELRRESDLAIVAVPAVGSKQSRADAVAPVFEAGKAWLPESASWLAAWIDEHVSFPRGAHDDQVDTTAHALARLRRHAGGEIPMATAETADGGEWARVVRRAAAGEGPERERRARGDEPDPAVVEHQAGLARSIEWLRTMGGLGDRGTWG